MKTRTQFTITNVLKMYEKNEINSKELIQELYQNYEKHKDKNIYLSSYFEELLNNRSLDDQKILPISVKDLYFIKDRITTAASRMLESFVAPCDSEVISRLKNNNFIFTGKTNLDEFAMGSSGKTSAFGQTLSTIKNKNGDIMSPGGSSSGAVVSLLAETCLAALGTDTGGSIRQPASWTGLYGYKPTYGIFSRHGIIEMAHSLDCPGLITHCIDDIIYMWKLLIGKCSFDLTTVDYKPNYINHKKKIGLFIDPEGSELMQNELQKQAKILESQGYEIKEINIDLLKYCINIYYIICPLEVASNMAKYNGIFYNKNFGDIYINTRTQGFGDEVKRRIMIGNYIAYNIHESNLYSHALKLLNKLNNYLMDSIFNECDCILMPTYDGVGMTINETIIPDPIKMYKCDLYTCFNNLLGIPGLHVPTNYHEGLPLGVQLVGPAFSDHILFDIAKLIENNKTN